jgi:hypothetical protein
MALFVAWLGLSAALKATPVTVPDFSFELTTFATVTNTLAPGGTLGFNNAPNEGWWGSGFADISGDPTIYIQNADITNGLFPLTAEGALEAPADGTNYAVVGGSGDNNVWEPIASLQSNTIYTLTVAVGLDTTGQSGGGAGLIALVSGTELYDIFTPGAILASLEVQNTNFAAGTWSNAVLTFTNGATSSGELTILLRGTTGYAIDFDNVRLDATAITFTSVVPTVLTDVGTSATNVYEGTLVTLSENPVGTPPFKYEWETDNGTHGATWTAISGATNASYVVNTASINPDKPVSFEVVVTNGSASSTSPSVTLSTMTNAPILVRDTLPSAGSFDVVGSQVAFSAVFDGSRPIYYQWQLNGTNIAGATNETLTLSDLNTNMTGAYDLFASNALGTNYSAAQAFTVNALPPATNGIVVSTALEWGSFFGALGYNSAFTPTWTLATNSIIAGIQPSSSFGVFTEAGCSGLPVLTSGSFADISPPDNGSACFATCGDGTTTNGFGSLITYTLPETTGNTGWTITNITSYGGWADDGREQQTYQISYSTPLAPTNFSALPWTAFDPPNPPGFEYGGGVATATKMSIIPTNGVLAKNVGAIQINFYSLAAGQTPKNGWEGYAQFQLFGVPATNFPPAPTKSITPASGSDVAGSSVIIEAGFASLEPITYTWTQDGVVLPGQTNSTLVLTNLQLTDTSVSPGYVLEASNSFGVSFSAPSAFTVNPAPGADGFGVVISEANQAVPSGLFTPTWVIATNSLIEGLDPYLSVGNFQSQGSANGQPEGGVAVLTDGQYGAVGEGDTLTGASAGPSEGTALYYNLPASPNGWNITSIETYGGWSDIGRNNQGYTVYFATPSNTLDFVELDSLNSAYSPPVTTAEPNATRVIWTPGAPGFLATNVAAVEFQFTVPVFNNWEGYNELQIFGTPATVPAPPVQVAPILVNDIAPGYASDVVGSSVTFNATFAGATSYSWQYTAADGTVSTIAGATNSALTLTDLTTNMTGGYGLMASNAYGTTPTSVASLTVDTAPTATNGILMAAAVQINVDNSLGLNPTEFTPTWTIAGGSLIAHQLPSTVGPGNFALNSPSEGLPVLTSGTIGVCVGDATDYALTNFADGGTVSSGAGQYLIYTLKGSANGYNISSIVTYGGWDDFGRDWQYYTISYATAASPTTFIPLAAPAAYQLPHLGPAAANLSRLTWTEASGGPIASNVTAVEFNFTLPAGQENNWQGYAQIQLFGTPSSSGPPPKGPTITSSTISSGNLVLAGTGGTANAAFAWLTTTNLDTPLSEWTTNTTGTFNSSGDFSTSIAITNGEGGHFFVLKTP